MKNASTLQSSARSGFLRRRSSLVVLLVLALGSLTAVSAVNQKQSREQLWKQANQAISKGLPKTAIKHLAPIIESAIEDKDYDEAIKAIGKKISLEGTIQGNKPDEKIRLLEAVIKKSPREMKPVLTAIEAHWYWHYFQ